MGKDEMSVAESPPDLAYPKLPFWDTVTLSYSSYFRHFTDAVRASWLWLLVAAGFTCFASWQQWSSMATAMANLKPDQPPPETPEPAEIAVLLNISNILLLLAGLSIAVAWHRLMILGERPRFSGSNLATKTVWRYIGMAIAIFLINFLPAAVVMFPALFLLPAEVGGSPPPGLSAVIPLVLVLAAIGFAAAFRLSLLLPARAVGDSSVTFKQAWLRTRGNTWRLFWGIALTTIPPLLLVQIAFLTMIGFPVPGTFSGDGFVTQMTATSTVTVIYYLLITPIGIGFLSHAYRHFFQGGLEPIE